MSSCESWPTTAHRKVQSSSPYHKPAVAVAKDAVSIPRKAAAFTSAFCLNRILPPQTQPLSQPPPRSRSATRSRPSPTESRRSSGSTTYLSTAGKSAVSSRKHRLAWKADVSTTPFSEQASMSIRRKAAFPQEIRNIAGSVFDRAQPDAKNRLIAEYLNSFLPRYRDLGGKDTITEYQRRSFCRRADDHRNPRIHRNARQSARRGRSLSRSNMRTGRAPHCRPAKSASASSMEEPTAMKPGRKIQNVPYDSLRAVCRAYRHWRVYPYPGAAGAVYYANILCFAFRYAAR